MDVSLELTLSPLDAGFDQIVLDFIGKLEESEYAVVRNPLSTHIYGDYRGIMDVVVPLVEETFKQHEHILLYMKIVNGDRRD